MERAIWHLKDLDPQKIFEVIPDRNPETSLRFSLPVPNWMGENGQPLFDTPDIRDIARGEKIEKRFFFYNHKDQCDQCVKINGEGAIIFMSPTPDQSARLVAMVQEYAETPHRLTPVQLRDILHRTHDELGLGDRYHENISTLQDKMDAYDAGICEDKWFGGFLQKPVTSSAVYIDGAGAFMDGPAASPQKFDQGAFIAFPGMTAAAVKSAMEENAGKLQFKLVQPDVFCRTRTYPNGARIAIPASTATASPRLRPDVFKP